MTEQLRFGQVFTWRPGQCDVPVMVIGPAEGDDRWKIVDLDDVPDKGGIKGEIMLELGTTLRDPDIYRPEPD